MRSGMNGSARGGTMIDGNRNAGETGESGMAVIIAILVRGTLLIVTGIEIGMTWTGMDTGAGMMTGVESATVDEIIAVGGTEVEIEIEMRIDSGMEIGLGMTTDTRMGIDCGMTTEFEMMTAMVVVMRETEDGIGTGLTGTRRGMRGIGVVPILGKRSTTLLLCTS